jgi:acetolactate synthase-1/2/3 large subunit
MIHHPERSSGTKSWAGGRAVAEMVRLFQPGPIFGMGGFQLLPFYEGARELGLRHILINDERAGAFAADAYARVTGKPGLCDGTLGPGATNLVTALVESLNAGIPIVAFVGDSHRAHSWKNMTQEARQREILTPAVKEYLRVEEISRIPELVRRAFSVATSGRPGPVVLSVPEDIAHEEHEFELTDFYADLATMSAPALRSRPARADVDAAVALLRGAQRPVILVGGGFHLSVAYDELDRVSRLLDAPVAHTLSGKGAMACTDDRNLGLFGRYSRFANEIIEDADVLLVVGCKLGEIATKRYTLPRADIPIIHLDNVAEEIGRHRVPAVSLWADAREGLADLADALEPSPAGRRAVWADVAARRAAWLADATPKYRSGERPIHMARLIAELNAVLPGDAIVVADGDFACWSARPCPRASRSPGSPLPTRRSPGRESGLSQQRSGLVVQHRPGGGEGDALRGALEPGDAEFVLQSPIARLSGGRVLCRRLAARPTWRSSATATKHRSARRSTPTRYPCGIESAAMVLDTQAAAGKDRKQKTEEE